MNIDKILEQIDVARAHWSFEEDPGPGEYKFGVGHQLRISDHEKSKGEITRRYLVEMVDNIGHPITMSYNWEGFRGNLSKPSKIQRYTAQEEEFDMGNLSIHDDALREKVRLKCKNDWDLDLNEDQVSVCIMEMEEQKLSLFHNQIWPNKRKWNKKTDHGNGRTEWKKMERITWDKTIDGYRAVAHRTGRFAGIDAPVFDTDESGQLLARITVYALDSIGARRPYVGEARFCEFVQLVDEWDDRRKTGRKIPNGQWSEKPHNMIAVTAERQALRKAFQETDDDQVEIEDIAEARIQDAEADMSHGEVAHPNDTEPEVQPQTRSEKAPEVHEESGKKDLPYIGIPKEGFSASNMLNEKDRIVMCRAWRGDTVLALDSGEKVHVNTEGYEVKRGKRTDEFKGGRLWEDGSSYYGGQTVEKIADSKKGELFIWLALDNGFKVLLDRWGKEIKIKKLKKLANPVDQSPPAETQAPEAPESRQPPVEEIAPNESQDPNLPNTSERDPGPQEADATGNSEPPDIESMSTVEQVRKVTEPLLKRWCNEIFKKRVSPKQAYQEFTGVLLKKGQPMSLDDYKVLHQCLEESFEETGEG